MTSSELTLNAKWPTPPELSRFIGKTGTQTRVFTNQPFAELPKLVGAMLEATRQSLLSLEIDFDLHISGSVSSVVFNTKLENTIYSMPFDNGETHELSKYLSAYEHLVKKSDMPRFLLASVHLDGWFTFDSCEAFHGRLPTWAFNV